MEQSEGSESEALRARFKRYENSRSVCIFHLSIPELLATFGVLLSAMSSSGTGVILFRPLRLFKAQ